MRRLVVTALVIGALLAVGGGQALAAPGDQGGCVADSVNAGSYGEEQSTRAQADGQAWGQYWSSHERNKPTPSLASSESCRP